MIALEELTVPRIEQDGPSADSDTFVYVDISSVDNRAKRVVEPKELPRSEAPSRARQRLRAGDVLVSMTRPNLNAVAMIPHSLDGAVASTGFHVLRVNEKVTPEWLFFGVQTRRFVEEMSSLVQGALYPAVRPKDIRAFRLPTPPLAAQRGIVAEIEKQFSRLDQAVANLQQVNSRLALYRDAVLLEALGDEPDTTIGALIESGPQNGLYLPKGRYGAGTPILRIDDYQTDWTRPVADLRRVSADASQVAAWSLVPGDLVVNRVNSISHLGKCVSVPEAMAGVLFESNMMRFRLRPGVLPRYVELYLGSKLGKARLIANAKWAVNQASINQQDVLATALPLPETERQRSIVAEVDRRLSIVRGVEAEVDANLKRAQALRQAILARAFSG